MALTRLCPILSTLKWVLRVKFVGDGRIYKCGGRDGIAKWPFYKFLNSYISFKEYEISGLFYKFLGIHLQICKPIQECDIPRDPWIVSQQLFKWVSRAKLAGCKKDTLVALFWTQKPNPNTKQSPWIQDTKHENIIKLAWNKPTLNIRKLRLKKLR